MPLKISVNGIEEWDEAKEEFVSANPRELYLEHSLVSISKWEAKWKKPFLDTVEKTDEELRDYVRCMSLKEDDEDDYSDLPNAVIAQIGEYIRDPMTATWITSNNRAGGRREIVTSELIYYWMVAFNIPSEYQYWHLNRLMMLIQICNEKNKPPKKMSKGDIMSRNRELNAARRARLKSKG